MALQQVGPKKLTLPLKSEFITSIRHPGTPERDDQHSCMSLFPTKIPSIATLLVVILETFLFPFRWLTTRVIEQRWDWRGTNYNAKLAIDK